MLRARLGLGKRVNFHTSNKTIGYRIKEIIANRKLLYNVCDNRIVEPCSLIFSFELEAFPFGFDLDVAGLKGFSCWLLIMGADILGLALFMGRT